MTARPKHHQHKAQPEEMLISGWTVQEYTRMVKWPVLITFVLNIIVTTAKWNPALIWFFLIVLTIILGVFVTRVNGTIGNAAGVGVAAGLIVGVATSLFQFIWFHTIEFFFRIITTSFLSILVGVLMSTSAFLVVAREHRPSEKVKKK